MRLLPALIAIAALAVLASASEDKDKDKKDIGTVIGIDLGTTYSWYVYNCTIVEIYSYLFISVTLF